MFYIPSTNNGKPLIIKIENKQQSVSIVSYLKDQDFKEIEKNPSIINSINISIEDKTFDYNFFEKKRENQEFTLRNFEDVYIEYNF